MFKKLVSFVRPPTRLMPHQVRAKYGIPAAIPLHIEFQKDGWMVATSPDLPGFITQARDAKELAEMASDAILTYFDVPEAECDNVIGEITGEGTLTMRTADRELQAA